MPELAPQRKVALYINSPKNSSEKEAMRHQLIAMCSKSDYDILISSTFQGNIPPVYPRIALKLVDLRAAELRVQSAGVTHSSLLFLRKEIIFFRRFSLNSSKFVLQTSNRPQQTLKRAHQHTNSPILSLE